jgi:hypothetical protein
MPALKSHVLEMFSSSVKKWELATQGKANWKTTPRLLKATSIASSHRLSGRQGLNTASLFLSGKRQNCTG